MESSIISLVFKSSSWLDKLSLFENSKSVFFWVIKFFAIFKSFSFGKLMTIPSS